jgi:hypothetical protein
MGATSSLDLMMGPFELECCDRHCSWRASKGAHYEVVQAVAYSPDGRHIISGSGDMTIRIWDGMAGGPPVKPRERHTGNLKSIANSSNGRHMVSAPAENTNDVSNSFPSRSIQYSPFCNLMYPHLLARPDPNGWVRDSEGGLLYWVPPDCRIGLHSPALMTIPPTSDTRSVSLDFANFAFGTSWAQIFQNAQP